MPTIISVKDTPLEVNVEGTITVNVESNNEFAEYKFESTNDTIAAVGETTGIVNGLIGGEVNITITALGDDRYLENTTKVSLKVNKLPTIITVKDLAVKVDDELPLDFTYISDADIADFNYEIGNKSIATVVDASMGIISYKIGGNVIITIVAPETEKYLSNSTNVNVTVNKLPVNIDVENDQLSVDVFGNVGIIAYSDGDVDLTYASCNESIATVDENGAVTAIIGGTVNITVISPETDRCLESSKNVTVTVNKLPATISVLNDNLNIDVFDNLTLNTKTNSNGVIVFESSDENIAVVEDGVVYALAGGKANITVSVVESDKYLSNSTTVTITTNKVTPEIGLDVSNITVGETENAFITVPDGGKVNIVLSKDSKVIYSSNETIKNYFKYSNDTLAVGNYTVTAVYYGSSRYIENTISKDFIVRPVYKYEFDVEVGEAVIGEEVNITVTLPADAKGIIKIGNEEYEIDGEKTVITLPAQTKAGKNNVTVEYVASEDSKYDSSKVTSTYDVVKKESKINMEVPKDIKAGETVEINVSSNSDVEVYIDGEKQTVKDGKVTFTPTAGTHTVVATVGESDEFDASIVNEVFEVVKKDSSIEITATNVTEGQATTITVNTQLNEGIVVVKVGDKQAAVDLAKSKSVSITLDAPGIYDVSAEYLGSDIYAPAEALNTTVNVAEKAAPEVNVTIPSVKAGENETISVSVPNATGEVHVIVDGVDNIIPLDENGKANYTVPQMTAGDHSIVVVYPGDDTHDSKVVSQSITVDKQSSKADITVPEDIKAGETANVTVNIPGATGNVSVIIDGAETVVPLDENGSAVIPVSDIAGGKHSVVVVYDGDDTHDGFHDSKSFDVAQMKSAAFKDITVESSSISAVLADENGNPIKDALITYKINGKQSTTKTDDKGMFTINGISKAAVEFAYEGNDSIEPVNMSIDLQGISPIKTATEIKGEDFAQFACEYYEGERGSNFTFRLVDSQGKALANKQLYIGYNGVTLNRTTDENGYASVQINLKNAGLYTFVIVFLGDSDYNASMAVHKVTINKKTTSISAGAKTFKASAKTKKYTVTLKTIKGASIDGKTYLAAGKKVTLKINGKTYTAKTNAKGQATFSLKITKKGKFTASIKYDGDVTYKASSKSVKITIK